MGLLYIVFSPNMLHFTRISEKQVEQKNQQKMTSKRGSQPGRPQVELSSLDHSNKHTLGQTQHNSEESVDTHDSLAGRGRDVIRSCETAASRRSRSAARGSGTCAVKKKKVSCVAHLSDCLVGPPVTIGRLGLLRPVTAARNVAGKKFSSSTTTLRQVLPFSFSILPLFFVYCKVNIQQVHIRCTYFLAGFSLVRFLNY